MTDNPETLSTASPAAGRDKQRSWPGRGVWLLLTLLACVYVVVRLREWEDSAVGNIVSLIVLGLAGLTLLGWFTIFSTYRRSIRIAMPLTMVCAVAVLYGCFDLRQTTGGLIPRFSFRWSPPIDEQLGEVQIAVGEVDLAATTPDDFPQFLGPDRNGVVPRRSFSRDWIANPPRPVWRQTIGAGWSSFAAVNGFAVTMEQRGAAELVTCYEIATGNARWTHAIETRHETVFGFVGPRATPTIHNGRAYALGGTGILRCLSGADGTEVWIRDLFAEHNIDGEAGVSWGRSCSPLIVDDKVIVAVGGNQGGPYFGLGAYDIDTGDAIWNSGEYQASYASPSLMTIAGQRQIVSVMQDYVVGINIDDGEVLWEHAWPGASNANANVSQASLVGDHRLFLSKGYFHGAELIELHSPDQAGNDWQIEPRWRNAKNMKTKFSNTVIKDGFVFGMDDIALSCVELETGKRRWKKGRYRYGQVLLVEDVILVAAEDGRLVMVAANPEKFEELGSVQMIEGQTWNNACLYGRYVLLRNSIEAACIELPAK